MRSSEFFDELWHESSMIARRASISVPMDDEEPAQKRREVIPSILQASIIMSTFGARLPTCAAIRYSHFVAYYEVIDRFSAEMERRLMRNNSTLTMLAIHGMRGFWMEKG